MANAIRFHETGGPEVLRWEQEEESAPQPNEVLIRHTAIGLNFIDTYHRSGLYSVPSLPSGLGVEGAGVVEAVGDHVVALNVGDRVGYAGGPVGSYCEQRCLATDRLVKLPDWIDDQQAAAIMLKGLTTQYLLRLCYQVQRGDMILVHAAAGGVGLLLCQWARHLGATVIGTVGSQEKADLAAAHGCEHPILYREEDFAARVREITDGVGVPVVYDSVGRDTFEGSLDCLRPRGLMVSFGQSSGSVEPIKVHELTDHGSLFLTRPTLAHYTAPRSLLEQNASELFDVVQQRAVKIHVNQTYALSESQKAHEDLESRRTSGSTVLVP